MSDGFRFLLLSSSSHIFLPSKAFLGATIRAGATFQEHQALDDKVEPEHQALDDKVEPEHQAFQEQGWPGSRGSQQRVTQVFLSLI